MATKTKYVDRAIPKVSKTETTKHLMPSEPTWRGLTCPAG